MTLSAEQEAVIQETAPVVAEYLNDITARFYPLMFARYPEVRALFNAAHQESGHQARALAEGVLKYVQLRQQPQAVRDAMAVAISKHVSLGVQPEHYPIVGECLMAAIQDVLGEAVTPAVADAWSALYQELADWLIGEEASLYDAFATRPGGWRGHRRFRIRSRRPESREITSFELEPVDGEPVAEHRPGQYIGVRLEIDGEPVYRHYSLSAVPNGQTYRISVKREPEGRVSRFLHDQAQEGFELDLLPPAGDLTLRGDEPLLMLSGGVGQTPLLPMAQEALAQGRAVTYVHATRDVERHAFRNELERLSEQYPALFRPVVIYENPALGGDPDHGGLINRDLLADYLPQGPARCYFVGPQGFMSHLDRILEELGIADSHRHYEHFGPSRPLESA